METTNFNFWNQIYSHFDPVAFTIGSIKVHWYGLAYVSAMLIALFIAKYFIKKYPKRFYVTQNELDSYFIWAELGVILGARIGYILIYSTHTGYYLTHPWQIFNPFNAQGSFVGIAGMSYHGALVGFVVASIIFCVKNHKDMWRFMDLAVLSIPLGYFLGRVGNFLNQELFGREIESDSFFAPFGILVDGTLRYPSQLIEGVLEGFVVFIVLCIIMRYTSKKGILLGSYSVAYGIARYIAEYTREADTQMGYYGFLQLSMGQILCLLMIVAGFFVIFYAVYKDADSRSVKQKRRKS